MKIILATIVLFGFLGFASAEETAAEKVKDSANTVKRSVKKGVHRAEEAVCGTLTGDNKVECLAKEAKNRVIEAKDVVVDKAAKVKNAVDTDGK